MLDYTDFNFDIDGDGILDSYAQMVDVDGDGVADVAVLDINGDGVADGILNPVDLNGDGMADDFEYLSLDNNAEQDWQDDYDDGSSLNEELNVDLDGDGIPDAYTQEIDTNSDGILDTIQTAVDTNGDGIADTIFFEADTNGDGIIDQYTEVHDYNQDGNYDDIKTFLDTDVDGIFEQVTMQYDSDNDGIIDTIETHVDYDGDGIADTTQIEQFIDSDGDGEFDKYIVGTDVDGDNVFETVDMYDYDVDTETLTLLAEDDGLAYIDGHGTYAEELDNYDPTHSNPDAVVGHPEEAMAQWEFQGNTGRCALYSQKFVIEELTGHEVDIEEIADLAEEHGWFTEEGGTPVLNMDKILDYYGIDNEVSFHNSIDDLRDALEGGHKVIVSIDSDEIWHGENDSIFVPGDAVDHAVEVIGIDYTDSDNPMVILNDSGTPDGCGEMVPLDTFVDAWDDGSNHMITI